MKVEIDKFMQYLIVQKNASPMTIKSYRSDLNQFLEFLKGDVSVDSIGKDEIRGFIEYCYDAGLNMTTIRRKIFCLKSFFKFLYNNDIIKVNPARSIIIPKKSNKIPKFLTFKQVKKLLSFPLRGFLDYRDKALLETFYSSGARIEEIASANITDCDFEGGRLRVNGKGSVERIVFLGDDSVHWLKKYLEEREKKFNKLSDPLFINRSDERITVRGIFYAVIKRAEETGTLGDISPHTLRHSFATELLNRGCDIRFVQEMLGHKSVSNTQTYLHTTTESLRKAYEKFHPHSGENYEESSNN